MKQKKAIRSEQEGGRKQRDCPWLEEPEAADKVLVFGGEAQLYLSGPTSVDEEQSLCLLCAWPESSQLTSAVAQVDDRTPATSPWPRSRVTLCGTRPPGDNHPAGPGQVLTRPAVAESLALLHGAHGRQLVHKTRPRAEMRNQR